MVLPYEYFKSKSYITDLQGLKDRELYFIIRLFQEELNDFNKSEDCNLEGLKDFNKSEDCNLEGLNKAFIKMKDLFKDIRFILDGYINVINENDLTQCGINEINYILTGLDEIEYYFTKIKYIKKNKNKVNDLVYNCLLKIRGLYVTLSEFIYNESHLWESDLIIKKNLI